ncbi:MAG: membrane dipeptidase [Bacteroidetes bacterium]|nr:MAG: membrane dipeptidase [Bacteroidota bacterium]
MVDGHVDLPYKMQIRGFRLAKTYLDPSGAAPEGDFDYPRTQAGGLDAPFMSIFVPSDRQTRPGAAKALADSLISMIEGLCAEHPDKFVLAHSPAAVEAAFAAGKVALPMGMENGAGIEDNLANLAHFHKRGIRYITLTHSKDNLICDSSYDTTHTWNGLSPFGAEVVREMNRLGIMVDISHVSDSAFYDVLSLAKVPVIASHSSCRAFTPGFERNMSDDMIRKMGENGGVIMINFGSTFVDSVSRQRFDEMDAALHAWADEHEANEGDSAYEAYRTAYIAEHGSPYADVERVADHIDHVVQLIGVDYVGFGSDFDGVGDSLPRDLKDVGDYPKLIAELLRRGYTEADLEKICGGNLLRVWREVEAYAAAQAAS